MNWTHHSKLRLLSRNEGKIKSYDSCLDVRAWSHDLQTRNNYLRDWMKSDMPVCVIPLRTISGVLRNMTWRHRSKVTPRCHPNCRSKVILESICNSTYAIKECLKNRESFDKYFQEEELETSTWPCDKCLEALKSIQMFWRIIAEKLFRVKLPKEDTCKSVFCSSVQSIAESIEENIRKQCIYIRNVIPNIHKPQMDEPLSSIRLKIYGNGIEILTPFQSELDKETNHKCVGTEGFIEKKMCKINKSVSVHFETVDFGCETCDLQDDVTIYKNNIEYLQRRLDMQNVELSRLTKENITMRLELQKMYSTYNWDRSYSTRGSIQNPIDEMPVPYESCEEESLMSTESEMFITLKNCKNKNYNNISLLQVIHKSNESSVKRTLKEQYCNKQEDPIDLLTKVHDTFGAIVQREMSIVNERPEKKRTSLINATYFNVTSNRSAPTSTISLHSISSASVFVSTTE